MYRAAVCPYAVLPAPAQGSIRGSEQWLKKGPDSTLQDQCPGMELLPHRNGIFS